MATYVFKEKQHFNQPWVWAIVLGALILTLSGLSSQGMENWEIIIPILIIGLVIVLFVVMSLETRIDEYGLSYSFYPLIRQRRYKISEIENLELVEYNSITKFGGWGIRYNFDMWAYNVRGKHGLLVTLRDKKFMIGTQKPEEMQKAIQQFKEIKSGDHAR